MEGSLFEPQKAPELLIKNENWLNLNRLSVESLKGNIVVLHFWNYSSINCLRTIDFVKEMWEKHKDRNVRIIGIHTPEFGFEKDLDNLMDAVEKLGIKYPIINDPECINWKNYGNEHRPRIVVMDTEGRIIFDHIGESGYDDVDRSIIREISLQDSIEAIRERRINCPFFMSKKTYTGSIWKPQMGSVKLSSNLGIIEYHDPGVQKEGTIYLKGMWKQEPEYLEFEGNYGYILFRFTAREVNAIVEGNGSVEILFDGETVDEENIGKDVVLRRWKSWVDLDRADMYNLLNLEKHMSGDIKIIPFKGFRIYGFSFG